MAQYANIDNQMVVVNDDFINSLLPTNDIVVNEEELVNELGMSFLDSTELDLAQLNEIMKEDLVDENSMIKFEKSAIGSSRVGNWVLRKIKFLICKVLDAASSAEEIIAIIVDAIGKVFPLGNIASWLLKKLIAFVIDRGISLFCEIA